MECETWKDIQGFEGRYQVSNLGAVKSLPFLQRYMLRNGKEAFRRTKERVIAQQPINSGYAIVHLHFNNVRTALLVHRLVAQAFVSNPDGLREVNHKSGEKSDNRADNLEWVSSRENHVHAVNAGLNSQAIAVKLTYDQGQVVFHPSLNSAAQSMGVSIGTIRRALKTSSPVQSVRVEVA